MPANCDACGKSILSLFYMECCECGKKIDLDCLNIKKELFEKFTVKQKSSWVCPNCKCSKPKVSDVSSPISTLSNITFTRGTVSKLRNADAPISRPYLLDNSRDSVEEPSLSTIAEEIRMMHRDMSAVRDSIRIMSNNFTKTMEAYDLQLKEKDAEIDALKKIVSELQITSRKQDQYNVRNELEIIGLPEGKNENLPHLVLLTSKKMGVDLDLAEIDDVRRVGPKLLEKPSEESTPGSKDSEKPRFRPIVVKFVRKTKRNELVAASVGRKSLSSADIVPGSSSTDGDLTPVTRALSYGVTRTIPLARFTPVSPREKLKSLLAEHMPRSLYERLYYD